MIQSLSSNVNLLHQMQLSQNGKAEGPQEAEHDGDSDDGAQGVNAARTSSVGTMTPDYLGTMVNTLA